MSSFLSIEGSAEFVVREWIKLYRLSPRLTVLGTVVIALLAGGANNLTEQKAQTQREAKRLQNLNYTNQVQKLEETRNNLQALLEFVDDERQSLRASEQALQSHRQQHEMLRPLNKSDRKTIDALFAAQESWNQSGRGAGRGGGGGGGGRAARGAAGGGAGGA